jgi:hypothetical protein
MFKKLKTAIKFRVPLYQIIKLILTFWSAIKDKHIDKEEREELFKKLIKVIQSIIKLEF